MFPAIENSHTIVSTVLHSVGLENICNEIDISDSHTHKKWIHSLSITYMKTLTRMIANKCKKNVIKMIKNSQFYKIVAYECTQMVIKIIKNSQFCTINIFGRIHRYLQQNYLKNHENLGTDKLLCMNVFYVWMYVMYECMNLTYRIFVKKLFNKKILPFSQNNGLNGIQPVPDLMLSRYRIGNFGISRTFFVYISEERTNAVVTAYYAKHTMLSTLLK